MPRRVYAGELELSVHVDELRYSLDGVTVEVRPGYWTIELRGPREVVEPIGAVIRVEVEKAARELERRPQ
jgi:hypothetical protein